jgi:coenzyme F420 hydrogenase subunit beta
MSNQLSPTLRLYAIVEQGLCIGCGLCQSVAGEKIVQVVKTSQGYQQPVVVGELDHDTVDKIYDTCPGTRIEGLPENLIEDDTRVDNVWGPWRRMVRAWAGDPEVQFEGATGGVLTALGIYLLKSKRVDFILHAKTSAGDPSFGDRQLSFTGAEVFESAGSRYGPTAVLIDVADVLDRNQPFAFIGKPCDVAALRNYARHDERVEKLVKYCLTMVCGGYGTPASTQAFYRRIGFEPDDVTALRYRGRGCPGPTRVETKDEVKEVHYLDFWGDDEAMWALPFRCKICPDGIGEAADIAASDTWPGGSPNRVDSETDPGVNAVIARSKVGEELLAAAIADGALTIEYNITADDMSIYQPHQMRKKYAAWARHQGLADEGRISPQTARLRIEELAQELPEDRNQYQRDGTRKRIRDGKVDEPTPKV